LCRQLLFGFAQAIIGCMIARVLTSTIISFFLHEWPLFLGHQLLGHRLASCLWGLAPSAVRHFAGNSGIWDIAWRGVSHW